MANTVRRKRTCFTITCVGLLLSAGLLLLGPAITEGAPLMRLLRCKNQKLARHCCGIGLACMAIARGLVRRKRDSSGSISVVDRALASDAELLPTSFQAVMEKSESLLLLLDSCGFVTYSSPAVRRKMGRTVSDLSGVHLFDLLEPEADKALRAFFMGLSANAGSTINYAGRLKLTAGQDAWVEGTITNLLFDSDVNAVVCSFVDGTVRKWSERGVLEERRWLHAVFNKSIDGITVLDDNGRYLQTNPAATALLGYSAEEFSSMSFFDILDEASDARDWPVFITGEPQAGYIPLVHKSGERIICYYRATPNILPGIHVGILTDATQSKKAEERLRRSESRLADAQRLAQYGSWELDLQSGRLIWSKELFRIFDVDPETFPLTYQAFLQLVDPEYRAKVDRECKLIFENSGSFEVEYYITTSSGDQRYILGIGHAEADPSGRIVRAFGTAQNITARKKVQAEIEQSARKYKFLFEHNPMPMWVVDITSLRFLAVNEAALYHYGYTREEFLLMTAADLKTPVERERFLSFTKTAPNDPFSAGVWKHLKKDNEVISVEITMHQIVYDGRRAFLVLVKDVSEKLRAEAEIKASYHQLKELTAHLERIREEERSRIALEVHDELGQQLTGLKMDASWIARKLKSTDQSLHHRISDMIALIDETVRTVKRISSELRPGILDDLGLLSALEWQSQEFGKRTGIVTAFHTTISDAEPEKSLATNIFRVYQEALTNVARHAQATKVKTSLEIADGALMLMVRDNGKGFDLEEVKVKKSLGLVGMRERANSFGGTLKISSVPGGGTTIVLEVPYKKKEDTYEISGG